MYLTVLVSHVSYLISKAHFYVCTITSGLIFWVSWTLFTYISPIFQHGYLILGILSRTMHEVLCAFAQHVFINDRPHVGLAEWNRFIGQAVCRFVGIYV